jgi:hypothetical protein
MLKRKSWIDTVQLLRAGQLKEIMLEATSLARPGNISQAALAQRAAQAAPAPQAAPDPRLAMPSPGAQAPQSAAQAPPAQQQPAWAKWGAVPGKTELHSAEPSLASRTRPDLAQPAERYSSFHKAYHDPAANNKSLARLVSSSNVNLVYHGELDNGHKYIAKPVSGMWHALQKRGAIGQESLDSYTRDQPNMANRHDATYELMSAMGAHHMVTPGAQSTMHQRHQFGGPDPDPNANEFQRREVASGVAGEPAHVNEFMPGLETVGRSSQGELDKVDSDHRLHGMVAHLLFGNQDGHHENVMIHQSGHPVLIDHDMALDSVNARGNMRKYGTHSVKSVFTPGGVLDYQAKLPKDSNGKMIPVGTNYPPRMKEVLDRVADGYYTNGPGKLNLSPGDARDLQNHARDLLTHGLEGTLDRRIDHYAPQRHAQVNAQVRKDARLAAAAAPGPVAARARAVAQRPAAQAAAAPAAGERPLRQRKKPEPRKRPAAQAKAPSHHGSVQRALDDIRVKPDNSVQKALKGIRFSAPGGEKK